MHPYQTLRGIALRLQWSKGLRAGLAVSTAMVVCHLLRRPMAWAALGGFEAILVDNGGPYRSRLTTMATLMAGGALACVLGAKASTPLLLAVLATAAFCFAATFARVASQPIASTSVILLVIYFAGIGGSAHTLAGSLANALSFVLGGTWAALLSLILWPLDPFRPARLAVADCYLTLAAFASALHPTPKRSEERTALRQRTHEYQVRMRRQMELARHAVESTGARAASRTIRARRLTVLLETADMLFAQTIRWAELAESIADTGPRTGNITESLHWLSTAESSVEAALRHRPHDSAASFAPDGSHTLQHLRKRANDLATQQPFITPLHNILITEQRDALQNMEIAFEAVYALWTGIDLQQNGAPTAIAEDAAQPTAPRTTFLRWTDLLRANWTMQSLMMRHALRMAVVGAIDIILMRTVHVSHGSWLAMTSIIVLQPYGSGTLRKGAQRVGGTIAGGILAAILAASIHSTTGTIAVITLTSIFTLALYAVDYGWYCFFLTPTFVLLSLPHLRDWHFAGVRIGNTLLGALVAVVAMRLLWPEQEQLELHKLLASGAAADANYLRAMLRFWQLPTDQRLDAQRTLLAPARRACGLAIIEAQETLDRLLLEPAVSRTSSLDGALTFITYLQRLARAATTLSTVGAVDATPETIERVNAVALRLDSLSSALTAPAPTADISHKALATQPSGISTLAEQQLSRMERQAGILARAAQVLSSHP